MTADPWQHSQPVAAHVPDGTRGEAAADGAWQRASGGRSSARPSRPVGRVSSVIAEQPWFRCGTAEQRRLVVQAALDARRRAHDRRERVKAHPDLVERLCRSLGYSRFDQWSGFVPPTRMPGYKDNDWLLNTSPVRDELIAILHLVVEREKAGAAD